jgi:hypothetical protein
MYVCVCVCALTMIVCNGINTCKEHDIVFSIILIKQYYIVLQLLDKNITIVGLVLLMET